MTEKLEFKQDVVPHAYHQTENTLPVTAYCILRAAEGLTQHLDILLTKEGVNADTAQALRPRWKLSVKGLQVICLSCVVFVSDW